MFWYVTVPSVLSIPTISHFYLEHFPQGWSPFFFGLPTKKPSNEGTFGSHRCFALWTAKMEIIRWLPWRIAWPWWLGDWFHVILPAPGCQGKTLRILLNWQSCNATIWQRFGRSRLLIVLFLLKKSNVGWDFLQQFIFSMSSHSCSTCSYVSFCYILSPSFWTLEYMIYDTPRIYSFKQAHLPCFLLAKKKHLHS